jgi:uncharacterized protein YbjT (DUF2867 family)
MCAITGITGKVGGQAARNLISRRAFDLKALEAAFTGVDAVFVLLPPNFYPETSLPAAWQNLVRATESRETFA